MFNATPERLWPLLFNSRMDQKQPCYLLCGLPKPVECRLQNGEGGVGTTRECVSDKGTIQQTILEWKPNEKLTFALRETDIYFGPCVDSIVESFEIRPLSKGMCSITRVTTFKIKPYMRPLLTLPMLVGLKSIHRYVFRNWDRLSRKD
jgi:hypothetical protein